MEEEAIGSTGMDEEHACPPSAAAPELKKIHFALPADDQALGVEAENLWAAALGSNEYRIDNIPFYVYGISLNDVVRAEETKSRLVFGEVVSRSGHSTYRVLIRDSAGINSASFKGRWRALEELGCTCEIAKRRWVAIDVPPEADVFSIYRFLEAGEEQGIWTFEEGHCGHQV